MRKYWRVLSNAVTYMIDIVNGLLQLLCGRREGQRWSREMIWKAVILGTQLRYRAIWWRCRGVDDSVCVLEEDTTQCVDRRNVVFEERRRIGLWRD